MKEDQRRYLYAASRRKAGRIRPSVPLDKAPSTGAGRITRYKTVRDGYHSRLGLRGSHGTGAHKQGMYCELGGTDQVGTAPSDAIGLSGTLIIERNGRSRIPPISGT